MKAVLGLLAILAISGSGYVRPYNAYVINNVVSDMENKAYNEMLYLDNAFTEDFGEWGPLDECPKGTYAYAVEVKFQSAGHLDETALNGIKFYCSSKFNKSNIDYITSTVGQHGEWKSIKYCSKGFITGFRANVLEYQGKLVDDVAVENLHLYCDHGDEILMPIHDGTRSKEYLYGEWSSLESCDAGSSVCGIKTRVERVLAGDEVGLADVAMACCYNSS